RRHTRSKRDWSSDVCSSDLYMDFIDANTAWGKKRQVANTAMRKRASMLVTDEFGNKVEMGYKSEIMGVSVKDNPNAVRGKAAKRSEERRVGKESRCR